MDKKQLEKIGKEMVRKCGYLPLIISVLGGLLSKRKSIEEWVSVNKSMNAHVYRDENEIHGVLKLSFEDLPFYLKPCFLVMGQFREDENIFCGDLYRMWISHGMISHEDQGKDETLMDVAEAYLRKLVLRCLIQSKRHLNTEKYYECQLHDAMRELCLSEGKKQGFNFQVINYRGEEFCSVLKASFSRIKVRHLAIHFEGQMTSRLDGFPVHREDTRKYVRSLQFLNRVESEIIEFQGNTFELEKFELLRILVLMNFRFKGRHLKRIGNLIHLRLLSLRRCEFDELPSSIKNLKYLHTLDLDSCWNVKVPNVLKEMHRLKYLFLPHYEYEWVARNKYHLTLEGLGELETLCNFNNLVHSWKSIMTMRNLRSLTAYIYDNESLLAVMNAITTICTNLWKFILVINPGCNLKSTQEGLVILKSLFSCQTLIGLIICVPIKRLQLEECETEISISTLVCLSLYDCEIEDDPMQILGKFPFLEELSLCRRAFVGGALKCQASGCPSLKRIALESLPYLRKWTVEQGAMPLLSSVEINNCPLFWKIPDGLRFARNLQELTIVGMPRLGRRLDAEVGVDFDKVHHVPSIIIR